MGRFNYCSIVLIVFLSVFSCKEDSKNVPLLFTDHVVEKNTNALIDLTYPKAEGPEDIANRINACIENFLANEINMSETLDKNLSLDEAIQNFDDEYKSFKDDFSDTTQQWEAHIESEVTYESEAIVSVSISSYLDTGGAHGNSHVTFLNFDKKTGDRLTKRDIINDLDSFKRFVYPYFKTATKPLSDQDTIEDPFYGEGFQLPETIGFGNEGLILLYNVYEIASYAQGVTEFSIPLEKAKPFLNVY